MTFLSTASFWFFPLLAFIAVLALVPPCRILARKIGLVDAPGGRKDHEGEVPLIGGLLIFTVFIAVALMAGLGVPSVLYAAIVILLITGAVDDRTHLPALFKFGLQIVAASLMVVLGHAHIVDLGNLFGFGSFALGWCAVIFSITCAMLLINAINLMDGLDGLAGGASFIIFGWLLLGALAAGDTVYSPSIIVLMAALAGFLFYNLRTPWRNKASVFLGDAGSLSLGLMVAWYAIQLSPPGARALEPMVVAWILAVPVWDECAQFYRRVKEGRHPFSPDRGHFHHHFIAAGMSQGQASAAVLGVVFITGGIGVAGFAAGLPLPVLSILWIAGLLGHMAFSRDLANYPRLIGRLSGK